MKEQLTHLLEDGHSTTGEGISQWSGVTFVAVQTLVGYHLPIKLQQCPQTNAGGEEAQLFLQVKTKTIGTHIRNWKDT